MWQKKLPINDSVVTSVTVRSEKGKHAMTPKTISATSKIGYVLKSDRFRTEKKDVGIERREHKGTFVHETSIFSNRGKRLAWEPSRDTRHRSKIFKPIEACQVTNSVIMLRSTSMKESLAVRVNVN